MQLSELDSKRIAVLLSGGVDSSVVVYEFAKLGLHPDCFYIKIGPEDDKEWDCSSEEDLEMATSVAKKYDCKLEVVDIIDPYPHRACSKNRSQGYFLFYRSRYHRDRDGLLCSLPVRSFP